MPIEHRYPSIPRLDRQTNLILVLLMLLVVPLGARSQIVSGTFVAIYPYQNEIVVAADSRAIIAGSEVDDTRCKISALGNKLIYVAAGDSGMLHTARFKSWDARTIANDLFRQFSRKGTFDPVQLALAWREEVKKKLKIDASINRDILSGKKVGDDLVSAVFASFNGSTPQTISVSLSYGVNPRGSFEPRPSISTSKQPQPIILGRTELGAEFAEKKTLRSQQWDTALQRSLAFSVDPIATQAVSAVNFAIQYSPIVIVKGQKLKALEGPVDAVKLTPQGGIEWLQHKPSCLKN